MNMENDRVKTIIWHISLFAAFFLLSSYIVNRNDDLVFMAGIERYGSFMGWVKWFSHNWGGRIVPQGILVLLLQLSPIVFNLFNAFAWCVFLVYVKRIFDIDDIFSSNFVYVLVPTLIFVLIPRDVLAGTVFWKCANVLYLWGSSALLVAVYPVIKCIYAKHITILDYSLSVIGIIYTSSFEQAAACMCGIFLLLLLDVLYNRLSINWKTIALFVFALASSYYFCTLTGNETRSRIEVLGQLPKYDMYSLLDKILWGGWYVINYVESEAMFVVMLIAGTVVFFLQRSRKLNDPFMIAAYIMLGYLGLCTINKIGLSNLGEELFISGLFKLVPVDTVEFGFDFTLGLCSVIHFLVYVYLGCCIMIINPDRMEVIGFSFYFCSLASMWVMGFSPTIYASGSRPRFLCYLFLLCVEIRIISSSMSSEKEDWKNIIDFFQKRKSDI